MLNFIRRNRLPQCDAPGDCNREDNQAPTSMDLPEVEHRQTTISRADGMDMFRSRNSADAATDTDIDTAADAATRNEGRPDTRKRDTRTPPS